MEITNLYINLNNCLIDLQNNQKQQKTQIGRCNDYFSCVQINSYLVEQYKSLPHEICRNIANQRFDINSLSNNFKRLETIDFKIRDLQNKTPEIKKYFKQEAGNIEMTLHQFANDLSFDQLNEAEEWVDSVFYELERRKQERIDKMEQWKSAFKSIFKYAGIAIVAVFAFLWRMVNK